ncbi:MAG: SusD/RagB family nutrient-binding outer membrane lipoprotein [Flavobacteriaceae bacterium]
MNNIKIFNQSWFSMTSYRKQLMRLVLILFLALSACDDGFEELNVDPVNPTTIDVDLIISKAIFSFVDSQFSANLEVGMEYAHMAAENNSLVGQYVSDEARADGIWLDMFVQASNINTAYQRTGQGGEDEDLLKHAVVTILRSMYFQYITDVFGNIPYLEAGKGLEGISRPVYKGQEFIYKDIFPELDRAMGLIGSATSSGLSSADVLYNDDLQLWKKLANSLKLRMAMRMRFADPSTATQFITEAIADPLISSNEESAMITRFFSGRTQDQSPWYNHALGNFVLIGDFIIDHLIKTNDPRLFVYAAPVINMPTVYQGLTNGISEPIIDKRKNRSLSGPATYSPLNPTIIFSYAEVEFLLAEAALIGIGSGSAQNHFRNGIEMSLEYWKKVVDEAIALDITENYTSNTTSDADIIPLTDTDIQTFTASAIATLTGSEEEQLKQIMEQKWVAFFQTGMEAWSEIIRTGYPEIPVRTTSDIPAVFLGTTNGFLPRRILHPLSEKALNPENYAIAVENDSKEDLLSRMWWDKK